MASAKWQMYIASFRMVLPILRALTRDESMSDWADTIHSKLDDILTSFPDDVYIELENELAGAYDPDDNTGTISPLPPPAMREVFLKAIEKQLDHLLKVVEELSGIDDEEDDTAGESEDEDTAEPAEPAARKAVGEAGSGKSQMYRGDIRSLVGVGGSLAFVTVHPEGAPTALYWLDADKLGLQHDALPCGGVALAADGNTVYVGGTDRRIYECGKKAPKPLPGLFGSEHRRRRPACREAARGAERQANRHRLPRGRHGTANARPARHRHLPERRQERLLARRRHREGRRRGVRRAGQGRVRTGRVRETPRRRRDGGRLRAGGTALLLRRCRQQTAHHVRPRQPRTGGQGPREHARGRADRVRARARRPLRHRQPRFHPQELAARRGDQTEHAQGRGRESGCARRGDRVQPAARRGRVRRQQHPSRQTRTRRQVPGRPGDREGDRHGRLGKGRTRPDA